MTVAAQVAVAQVVREQDHEVRRTGLAASMEPQTIRNARIETSDRWLQSPGSESFQAPRTCSAVAIVPSAG